MTPAGPFPTKEMFQNIVKDTDNLFIRYRDGGSGSQVSTPQHQLYAGPNISIRSDSVLSVAPAAPIKTLEFSWRNIPTSFDGFGLESLDGVLLESSDIERIEVLPLSNADPLPLIIDAGTRQGNTLQAQGSDLHFTNAWAKNTPDWMLGLRYSYSTFTSNMIGIFERPSTVYSSGCIIRITFSGNGTQKIPAGGQGWAYTPSHPGVACVVKDASGAVIPNANIDFQILQRYSASGTYGYLSPESLPMVPTPTPITSGTVQGMEVVWPIGGAPYLHIFKQGSVQAGEEYHLPLTPGLPQ